MKKILIGVAFLAILGGAAFVVASDGTKVNQAEMEKMRGTDAYYLESDELDLAAPYGEEELLIALQDKVFIKIAFSLKYKLGMEWMETPEMATEAFAKKALEIRSSLILDLSGRTSEDLKGAKLLLFQEHLIDLINEIVFPKKMARVEKVLFQHVLVQGG